MQYGNFLQTLVLIWESDVKVMQQRTSIIPAPSRPRPEGGPGRRTSVFPDTIHRDWGNLPVPDHSISLPAFPCSSPLLSISRSRDSARRDRDSLRHPRTRDTAEYPTLPCRTLCGSSAFPVPSGPGIAYLPLHCTTSCFVSGSAPPFQPSSSSPDTTTLPSTHESFP